MAVHYAVAGVKSLIIGTLLGLIEFPSPMRGQLNRLRVQIGAANAEGDTLLDVKVNGVSIYASPTDRPKILAGEQVSESFPKVDLVKGELLSVDVVAAPLGGISGLYVVVELQDIPTLEQYVVDAYQGALDRDPTEEELDDDMALLSPSCEEGTSIDAAKVFFDSIFNGAEYLALDTDDETFVEDLYQAVLGRRSDPGGFAYWVGKLTGSETRPNVQDSFYFCPEHTNNRVVGWCQQTLPFANALRLQGKPISSTAPGDNELLVWNATASEWQPHSFDFISGAFDFKTPGARAVTTAGLPTYTYSAGVITASANGALPAQDGVTLVANDSLLVKNETSTKQKYNGLYTVTQVGDGSHPFILTRRSDANTSAKVTAGMMVPIEDGTTNPDTIWWLTTNNPITLDTTALTFSQFAASFTLADDSVTNAKLANVATATFKGRSTAGTGDPEDLTATQATALLNNFVGDSGSGGTKGMVPAPATGDAAKFLNAAGGWGTPSGGTATHEFLLMANAHSGVDRLSSGATGFVTPGRNYLSDANMIIGSESTIGFALPYAGTIDRMVLVTNSAQPGTGSIVITVRKNGADTAVTATIASSAAAGVFTDNTHSFTVNAGDRICFKLVNGASGNSASFACLSLRYQPTIP